MGRTGTERFIGLEWLRFLLAVYVIVFHTFHAYPEEQRPFWLTELTGVGFFATSSFFVLSGFLLAHVYSQDGRLREPAPRFWAKRFANLYPLHLFSLALTAVVLWIIATAGIPPDDTNASIRFVIYDTNEDLGDASRESLHHFMSDGELLFNLGLQLLLLQAWNPYYLTFNPPLWSISTLFFFYLTFPLLAPRLMRAQHKPWWLLVTLAIYLIPPLWIIINQEYGIPHTGILHRMPLVRLPEFVAGILLYGWFREHRLKGWQPRLPGMLGLAALIVGSVIAAIWLLKGERFWYFLLHTGLLLPAQLALLYLCALAPHPRSERTTRWAQRLASASLPLFVLHVPIFILFSRSEKFLGAASADCLADWSSCALQAGDQPLSLWFYPLYLLLTIMVCVWTQEHAVKPARNWMLRRMGVR
ncbi:acyltransferase family protein [Stutzerimonas tarimensis]|uniref:Acyltransferase family protein n=1 Tax=Stutzerimonas tarimensis TaxID=1507735 RepID=A0ABV7T4P0_9GAMM